MIIVSEYLKFLIVEKNIEVKFTGTCENNILTIREGAKELPLKEPNKIDIVGSPGTVLEWLRKRLDLVPQEKSVIVVKKDELSIELTVDETSFYAAKITTKLELSEEFKSFGINSERTWEPYKLGEFIRMNRSRFESKDEAMELVTLLKDFKARVEKVEEKLKDTRGSFDEKRSQAVTTNLPKGFNIKIPIFKGMEAITLPLEIDIDPTTLKCSLVSPDAAEFIQSQCNGIIDSEIKAISELAPNIAIIYA